MANAERLPCFKAYDIRGRVPDELDGKLAYAIGRAFVEVTGARSVAIARDARLSGPELAGRLAAGLSDAGAKVFDLGLAGTEEIYFATAHYELDGGIAVTASHNPEDYNGMKLVTRGARPVSSDSGLDAIEALARGSDWSSRVDRLGETEILDHRDSYCRHLLAQVDLSKLRPLKIVCNAGNGMAGPTVDQLAPQLPFELIRTQWEPDGHFPNGVPNPLLPECRDVTADAVRMHGADLGIAWDGDFDRCFFFDANGRFIEGYYIVGLIAKAMLQRQPGARIIHDPRLTWNTVATVTAAGGDPVVTKTGHAFIKERMRQEDAIYGGEMSAHHYFRDFFYCDSGMLPWLLVTQLMCAENTSLAEMVDDAMAAYPCSGELNFKVQSATDVLDAIRAEYVTPTASVDTTDGLSVDFEHWRFNVRASNTEPLLRLNVESRADAVLMRERTADLSALIQRTGRA
ncbi:MAG: phosphomannomutase [Pseudomonadota bacterium]